MFVVGLAVLVVAAVLVTVLVVAPRGRTVGTVDQSRPGPVLLVPGYGGSVTSLGSLAAALRATGRDVTIVQLPDHGRADLAQQATAVAAAAQVALARTSAGSVDVVGYSAGGVVARLWVTEDGGARTVRRLVTLGSPHHGTDLADLGALVQGACPVACLQLSPTSPLLARLDAEPLPAGPEYLSLWTTRDDVVIPPSSAVIEGVPSPSLQSICPASLARHGELPADALVQRLVLEALARGPVPTWGPADCTRLTS
jgi:hypothetical protein